MKTSILSVRCPLLEFIILSAALAVSAQATPIVWTNTSGGNWSDAYNWSPNQVPGSSDTAQISVAGSYNVNVDSAVTVQNLYLSAATLVNGPGDYLTVTGQFNWTNGVIACYTTIASNAVMTLAGTNGGDYTLANVLTNAGTLQLLSGNLLVNYCGSDNGQLFNLFGALIDLQGDVDIDISSNQFGLCGFDFNNAGTIRKSGGTGTSHIYNSVGSTGTVDVQTGTLSFKGGGDLAGVVQSEGAGALVFDSSIFQTALALDGNLTSTNAYLSGANLVGRGVINGVLTWTNSAGMFGPGDGALTVGTNGLLVLAGTDGTDYVIAANLINEGTIQLVSGNLDLNNCGGNFGGLSSMPGSLVDIENDVSIDTACNGSFNNEGTLVKSGGTGTSAINPFLGNSGTVIAQTGTISLNGGCNLTGGTLNFPISGSASFGQINLSGAATLIGTLSVDLNNGYLPANGSVFPLVTYGSVTGDFNPLELPAWIQWQTNYGPAALTITVSNSQPVLAATTIGTNEFSFEFLGNPSNSYSVVATTNLMLPLSNWTVVGSATFLSNDLFQYVGTRTTNYPQRFYSLRSP